MAALSVESEDIFKYQHSLFVKNIERPILTYLHIIKKLDIREKDCSFVEAKENGFNVYVNHCPPTFCHDLCNICKVGNIKIIWLPANVNNSNCNQSNESKKNVWAGSNNEDKIPNFKDLSSSDTSGEKDSSKSKLSGNLNKTNQKQMSIPNPFEKISYELNSNYDKDFELIIWKKGNRQEAMRILDSVCDMRYEEIYAEDGRVTQCKYLYNGCIFTCYQKKDTFSVSIVFKIAMGASYDQVDSIAISHNGLQKRRINVIKINGMKSLKEEIFIQGQIGPSDEKTDALHDERIEKIKRKERIPTYMRYIVFCDFIFEIDFYDYYVYSIVGKVYYPGKCLHRQWPWFNEAGVPIDPPSNDFGTVKYESVLEGINSNYQFFELFSRVLCGNFCGPVNDSSVVVNKLVLQLCLALGYSEAIRNYNTMKWNRALIEYRQFIPCAEDLKIVIYTHPMVTGGSFQKRKTGYSGNSNFSRRRLTQRVHNYNEKFEDLMYG